MRIADPLMGQHERPPAVMRAFSEDEEFTGLPMAFGDDAGCRSQSMIPTELVHRMHRVDAREPLAFDSIVGFNFKVWSGREDLNLRPLAPHASALPGCATPRPALSGERHSSDYCS